MTKDETIIREMTEKSKKQPFDNGSGNSEQSGGFEFLKRFSPSAKPIIIGCASVFFAIIIGVFIATRKSNDEKKSVNYYDAYLSQKMIPKKAMTPDYIRKVSEVDETKKRKVKRQRQSKIDQNKSFQEKGRHFQGSTQKQVPSMIIFSNSRVHDSRKPTLDLPLGTEMDAVIEETVVTDDSGMPVIARIRSGYFRDGKQVIPRNSKIFGYTGRMIENRVHVKFEHVVFPDGSEYQINAVAVDKSGGGGIQGKRKRKLGRRGMNILSGAMVGASSVFAPVGAGFSSAAMRGAHSGSARELERDGRHYRKTSAMPVVTIKKNTRFRVLVNKV